MTKQSAVSTRHREFNHKDVDTLRNFLVPGSYASVDVSQTKEKGLSVCIVTVGDGPVDITYFHQPFRQTADLDCDEHISSLIDGWTDELITSRCILIDSPLRYSSSSGGRSIDRKATWVRLGFGEYLNNEPKHAPTLTEAQAALQDAIETKNLNRKKPVTWASTPYTWIQVGIALDTHLRRERKTQTGEVYPTASFNALHLWRQAGLDITRWFAEEPGIVTVLGVGSEKPLLSSLRYLERIRTTPIHSPATRFRKLSYWEYPDLWDAFGGAVTAMLQQAGLTECVENAPEEGEIVVPMRISEIRRKFGEFDGVQS